MPDKRLGDVKLSEENDSLLLDYIGGKSNIITYTKDEIKVCLKVHTLEEVCFESLYSSENINSITIKDGNNIVIKFENEVSSREFWEALNVRESKKELKIIDTVLKFMADVFSPIIPALAGSGILKGFLLLSIQLNLLSETSGLYTILNISAGAIFYFLPVILAFSTAEVLGVNSYISVLISFVLLHPDFLHLFERSLQVNIGGIPVVLIDYSSTVVPIILAVLIYSVIYKILYERFSESVNLILIPLVTLTIVLLISILVIGPLGYYGGEILGELVKFLIDKNATLTGLVLGGSWVLIIITGMNWAINPIMLNNLSIFGYDFIRPFTFASNFSTLGLVLGVFLKTKEKELKSLSGTNFLTVSLSGIVEPSIYGIIIKNPKYIVIQAIGGAAGGAFLGFMKVTSNAFVFGSFITLPALVGEEASNLVNGIIGIVISMSVSAVLSYLITENEITKV